MCELLKTSPTMNRSLFFLALFLMSSCFQKKETSEPEFAIIKKPLDVDYAQPISESIEKGYFTEVDSDILPNECLQDTVEISPCDSVKNTTAYLLYLKNGATASQIDDYCDSTDYEHATLKALVMYAQEYPSTQLDTSIYALGTIGADNLPTVPLLWGSHWDWRGRIRRNLDVSYNSHWWPKGSCILLFKKHKA